MGEKQHTAVCIQGIDLYYNIPYLDLIITHAYNYLVLAAYPVFLGLETIYCNISDLIF